MNKSDPPTTFGVFKPTGHTVMAFHTQAELHSARDALLSLGFAADAMVEYSAEEMRVQAQSHLASASPLANFGYEIDLLRAHKDLADQGCSFLVVHAPDDAQAELVVDLVCSIKPVTAQHYGRFLIRDLTEQRPA